MRKANKEINTEATIPVMCLDRDLGAAVSKGNEKHTRTYPSSLTAS